MPQPSPTRRLVAFLLGLATLVGGAEAVVRLNLDAFEAAAHRARFKAALLARQGPLRFVAIGTSRFNDGVSPADVTRVLEAHGQQGRGFNASVPSSALATQAFLVERALAHPGLEALFLEVSPHQLAALEDDTLKEPPPAAGFEDRALAASALLRNRRVLMAENVSRLPALAFATRYDGSEFFRTRWLTESLAEGSRPPPLPPPAVVCPGGAAAPPADPPQQAALEAWVAMAQAARARGVAVYFVAPPISAAQRAGECGPLDGLWRALATRSGAPVLSWACADAPDAHFTDGHHHLGSVGRAAFSEALGLAWVAALQAPACEGPR